MISLQESKKVAMKDIEFYISDLDSTANSGAKSHSEFESLAEKSFQIKESLGLSMQLFIMSGMMETYYAQNQDASYLKYLESDMTTYLDKCEKRMLSSFSVLGRRMVDFKVVPFEKGEKSANAEKIAELVDLLNSGEESSMRKFLHRLSKNILSPRQVRGLLL